MQIFGRSLGDYIAFIRWGILALCIMFLIRVIVSIMNVPYENGTEITSLAIVGLILTAYYGVRTHWTGFGRYKQLLMLAFILGFVIHGLTIIGILLEPLLNLQTYFHMPGFGHVPAGMGLGEHIRGHLLAAFIYVPLANWLLMSIFFKSETRSKEWRIASR